MIFKVTHRQDPAKQAYWTEFHGSRKLAATARAGASVLRFHGLNRPSAESNTTLPPALRNRPVRPLANCCPIAQAIACALILALQITFRNKIPNVGVLRCLTLITSFGDETGLYAIKCPGQYVCAGRWFVQGRAVSSWAANRKSVASWPNGATNCTPTGSPSADQ